MGRPSKARAILVRAKDTLPTSGPSEQRLERLSGRFGEIREQSYRYLADSSRDAGLVLEEARKILVAKADFNQWRASLGVSRTSATNFVNVARLARQAPAVYERWRILGPTKLYRVARLAPAGRTAVLAKPGIEELTDAEFALLCAPHETEPTVEVTGNMVGQGLVQKALGMNGKLGAWQLPAITSDEIRRQLKKELLQISRQARELARKL